MKILVVDDEQLIRNVIKEYILNNNYQVVEASNGEEAIKKVRQYKDIDFIIMDIMMPVMDGYEASRQIKKIMDIPIIMLSARNEEFDKLQGFELGIDDYITKPFSPKELIARIKAVAKRNKIILDNVYTYQDLVINLASHTVKITNKEIKLTPKEYDLLCYFIKNENIVLSRETLLSKLWGYDYYGDDRTIDTHIKMLRNSLGKYRNLIVTVRTVGYKFEIKEK
ncbi:MAG: response regulator transcription factor [bacterium]|nr:response regulator transcription factor [bacterium]